MKAFLIFHWAVLSFACSAFLQKGTEAYYLGKSYDWDLDAAHLVINKRGVEKTALSLKTGEKGAYWVSDFGSITFNQYGREFPNGGINEKGLAVEILWLKGSVYEPKDSRDVVNELGWIQYQLDNFSSVEEMVAAVSSVRLSAVYAPVHYLACDATGVCATFEWLKGKVVPPPYVSATIPVLTNTPHANGMGDPRFARLAKAIRSGGEFPAVFKNLDLVKDPRRSVWQIGYDLSHGVVQYRTLRAPAIRQLKVSDFDFNCKTPAQILPIHEVKPFSPFDAAANEALIRKNLPVPLQAGYLKLMAGYPDTTRCKE